MGKQAVLQNLLASSDFDFPRYMAICANIESGATGIGEGYRVTNPKSTAFGRYQLEDCVFKEFNAGVVDHRPIAQEIVMYRLTLHNVRALAVKVGRWSFENVYLLHHWGLTGGIQACYNQTKLTQAWEAVMIARKTLKI